MGERWLWALRLHLLPADAARLLRADEPLGRDGSVRAPGQLSAAVDRPMRALLLVCCLLVCGCPRTNITAGGLGGTDADRAYLERLRERLREADPDDAEDIAQDLGELEIERARGRSGGAYLRGIGRCAAELEDALRGRAEQDDEVAAQAALLLAKAGLVPPLHYRAEVTSPLPLWRAAAARSLTVRDAEADGWRRRLLLDPARAVRAAALEAAAQTRDPDDVPAALEAARLDPDPAVRALAARAAGAIGGRDVVLALRDLWHAATDQDRVAIAQAWGEPASFDAGGRHQLVRAIQGSGDRAAGAAAARLLAERGPADAPAEVVMAAGALGRLIDEAPSRVRVAAIEAAVLDWPELAEAVRQAADSSDGVVTAAALSRLLAADKVEKKERQPALDRLHDLAKLPGPTGDAAKQALARAGDARVTPLLVEDAQAASAVDRANAAARLVRMGERSKALGLLGDGNAAVRAATACAILRPEQD